jgi:hypothetical protein
MSRYRCLGARTAPPTSFICWLVDPVRKFIVPRFVHFFKTLEELAGIGAMSVGSCMVVSASSGNEPVAFRIGKAVYIAI